MNTLTVSRQAQRPGLRPLIAAGLTLFSVLATADDFELPARVDAADILPPAFLRSAHYRIAPGVRARDNFYHFEVNSDYGNYAVTSLAMLRIRLHEIVTVAELAPRLEDGNARSAEGRHGVGSERVVDLLTDPVRTAAQLLGNIQHNVEQTFAATERADGDDDAAIDTALDLNPGPHKRSAAAQLGIDVYSSNPALQGALNAVAELRSAGKTASSISPLVRNVYDTARFGSGALDMRLESHLKNAGSDALNAELLATLSELGVSERVRMAFLTHRAFTPRTRLYFASYIELLAPLRGLDTIFAAAASAQTEADALAYVGYARMLAHYQMHTGDLAAVITESRFPTFATTQGQGVLSLPLDYLAWTAPVAAAIDALDGIRQANDLNGFILLLAGAPTARATTELARRLVELRAHYSY
jgi:hypothetical protein